MGACLQRAHLKGAKLTRAHLENANLEGAQGITQEQIDAAFGDADTKLPTGLTMPESWKKKAGS